MFDSLEYAANVITRRIFVVVVVVGSSNVARLMKAYPVIVSIVCCWWCWWSWSSCDDFLTPFGVDCHVNASDADVYESMCQLKLIDYRIRAIISCNEARMVGAHVEFVENGTANVIDEPPDKSCKIALRLVDCSWPHNFSEHLVAFRRYTYLSIVEFAFLVGPSLASLPANDTHRLESSSFDCPLFDLRFLDLSGNRIEEIAADVFEKLRLLRTLDLSSNMVTRLPSNLFRSNQELISLSLADNKITFLPNNLFDSLSKLAVLNLSYNALQSIHSDLFGKAVPLRELHVRHNDIEFVHENAFKNLHELSHVDLSHNNISFPYDPPCKTGQITPEFISNLLVTNIALFAKGPFVDLSFNKIAGISLSPVKEICFSAEQCRKLRIRLRGNPIQCECRAYDLIEYFRSGSSNNVKETVEIDSDLSCTQPDTNVVIPLSRVNASKIYCDISSCKTCPPGCQCFFYKDTVRMTVQCGGLNLTATPSHLRESHEIELLLRNNSLRTLGSPSPCASITVLSASRNQISDLSKIELLTFVKLQVLELDHNRLPYLNLSTVSQMRKRNLTRITLGHNPWSCQDCRIEPLVTFLRTARNVDDIDDVNCSGTNIPVASIRVKPCGDASFSVGTTLVVCSMAALFVVTPLAMYIGYKLRSKFSFTALFPNDVEMDEKAFDVFISYSHEDECYVSELTHRLEQRPDPFRVCLHSRNWQPGELIIKQIVDSIKRSRATIIVLSVAYTKSDWCTAEFQIALTHMLMRKNHKIIVIWCAEEDPAEMQLATEFRTYLQMCTYLKQDDKNFMKKLESAIERL